MKKQQRVKRPNCLNFKHKNVSKRNEAIEFKNLQFPKSKLLGVAEMPRKSIDVTFKSRDDVLKLYKNIQAVSDIIKGKLYETDKIHVVVGWVPVPMSNKSIVCVRILIIEKRVFKRNPISSYVHIDGIQLYVT